MFCINQFLLNNLLLTCLLVLFLTVFQQDFMNESLSNTPTLVTIAVAMVLSFTVFMFLVFNHLVERRQHIILNKAADSTAIVSSLFPKQVRDRLLATEGNEVTNTKFGSGNNRLKSFLSGDLDNNGGINSIPIADLFPNCTVMFADIAGFTAWSSTRGPELVFVLLQSLYHRYDQIAKRRKVFKVETIGDCYLAVTGLPEAQSQHATIMARFAWDCRNAMSEVTRQLEVALGPDCSDLKMRFGLHSGPVTAGGKYQFFVRRDSSKRRYFQHFLTALGILCENIRAVLKGDRARFQLFGDTVNIGKMTYH
jgi:Adenylate and Guanylate cyclase catalytic domain